MKCQILFLGIIRNNIINLLFAELAKRVIRIKLLIKIDADDILYRFISFLKENKIWHLLRVPWYLKLFFLKKGYKNESKNSKCSLLLL